MYLELTSYRISPNEYTDEEDITEDTIIDRKSVTSDTVPRPEQSQVTSNPLQDDDKQVDSNLRPTSRFCKNTEKQEASRERRHFHV